MDSRGLRLGQIRTGTTHGERGLQKLFPTEVELRDSAYHMGSPYIEAQLFNARNPMLKL